MGLLVILGGGSLNSSPSLGDSILGSLLIIPRLATLDSSMTMSVFQAVGWFLWCC